MAADIIFEVTAESPDGKTKTGTLRWPAHGLSVPAKSGPYGNGALPYGSYVARRSKMLDKVGQTPYCDAFGGIKHCWIQPFDDSYGRSELGIHPDGNVDGTEGCIGLKSVNSSAWYDAFYQVPVNSSTTVQVIKAF